MRIEEIDKNFSRKNGIAEPRLIWMDVKEPPLEVYGVIFDEKAGCYVRMPMEVATQVSEWVSDLNCNTSGGRVRFRTNSKVIGIHVITTESNGKVMPNMTLVGKSGFDVYRKRDEDEISLFYESFLPPVDSTKEYQSTFVTDGVWADYTINFPLYDGVKSLYVALEEGAEVRAATPYRNFLPIVYYGSSITQGGCASRPGNCYQAILSRKLNLDFINLGFSGNGKAEKEMVDYLANLKMSVLVCDYDHNAPDATYLQNTHLSFYKKVRSVQPDLPIIFLTAPDILRNFSVFEERRKIIRETYQYALQTGDKKVFFIDGAELFAGIDWDLCTVDGTHPNDLGFYRMALRIEKELVPLI